MRSNDCLADGQAHAGTDTDVGLASLIEALEHMGTIGGRDSGSVVRDPHHRRRVVDRPGIDRDQRSAVSERIGDQIRRSAPDLPTGHGVFDFESHVLADPDSPHNRVDGGSHRADR